MIDDILSKRYSSGEYTDSNPDFNDVESFRKAKALDEFLKIQGYSPKSIVDFGCGGGGFIKEYFKLRSVDNALNGYGIDLNPDAISYANSVNNDNRLSFFNEDITKIPLDNHYDLITCIHVLEHIHSWEELLIKLTSLSDYVYIVVPLEASVWHSLRSNVLLNQYKKYGHINFYNAEYLKYRIEELGINVVASDYSDEFRSFNSLGANVIKIPRLIVGGLSKSIAANFLGGYCLQLLLQKQ